NGAGKWEFPGGKIEAEEDPRDSLRREIREELGVDVQPGRISEVLYHRYPERSVLLLFYHCRWISGEPRAIDVKSFAWAGPTELGGYDFLEADIVFVRRIAAGEIK